jgi:hypothetical protein
MNYWYMQIVAPDLMEITVMIVLVNLKLVVTVEMAGEHLLEMHIGYGL